MTTAATIDVRLKLASGEYQSKMKKAAQITAELEKKVEQLSKRLLVSASIYQSAGNVFQKMGTKMNAALMNVAKAGIAAFAALALVVGGIFTLIIKKALDADTAISKLANKSVERLNTALAKMGEKLLPLFIKVVDWLTSMVKKFMPAFQSFLPAISKIVTWLMTTAEKFMPLFIKLGEVFLSVAQKIISSSEINEFIDKMIASTEKLIPLFVEFGNIAVDALNWIAERFSAVLDWFWDLDPATQAFVTKLVILAAMAGPLASFIGTILNIIAVFKTLQATLVTLIPSIVTFRTTLWAALAPILPLILAIIAIIAGLTFVIWAFATDFMGVTTTLKQLIWIIGYEFKKLGREIKQGWSEAMDWLDRETQKSADTWRNNFKQAEEIKQKLFKISVETMFKWWTDFSTKVTAKISEVRNWFINAWNMAAGVFYNIFTSISNFFNAVIVGIINGINSLIGAINSLGFALESLEIPEELTPGSPTPFEMGLRGISKAMDSLSKNSLPQFNQQFSTPSGVRDVGTGKTIRITDNRHFAAGLDARTLRTALDERFEGLTEALEAI